jgi:hypothetical protein
VEVDSDMSDLECHCIGPLSAWLPERVTHVVDQRVQESVGSVFSEMAVSKYIILATIQLLAAQLAAS